MKKIIFLIFLLFFSNSLEAKRHELYFVRVGVIGGDCRTTPVLGLGGELGLFKGFYMSCDYIPAIVTIVHLVDKLQFGLYEIMEVEGFERRSRLAFNTVRIKTRHYLGLGYFHKEKGFRVWWEPAGLFLRDPFLNNRSMGFGISKMWMENICVDCRGSFSFDGFVKRINIGLVYYF